MPYVARSLLGTTLALGLGLTAETHAAHETAKGKGAGATPARLAAAAGKAVRVKQPATGTANQQVPVIVLEVQGKVGLKRTPEEKWIKAEKGLMVTEGAQVQTSMNSAIEIQVGAGQRFTIGGGSTVTIKQAVASAGKETTKLALPVGQVKFEVTSAGVANDVQIQAPDATLAVKGTKGGMEVRPGFPTLAFGGDMNTGRIEVQHQGGVVATIDGEEATTSDAPNPAEAAVQTTQLDVGPVQARDGDESQVVARSTGGGESTQTSLGTGGVVLPPPPPATTPDDAGFFYVTTGGPRSGSLVRNLGTTDAVIRSGDAFAGSFGSSGGGFGLAIRNNVQTGERTLLRLESMFGGGTASGFRVLSLDLTRSGSVFTETISRSGAPFLFGLGTIGTQVYASGRPSAGSSGLDHGVYEILSAGETVQRMTLPFSGTVGLDLAGSNTRGSLFLFGNLGADVRGGSGVDSFYGGSVFEVDPRNNYVVRTITTETVGATTVFDPPTLNSGALSSAQVLGMAFVDGKVVMHVFAPNVNGRLFVTIDPNAAGTPQDPTIIRVALTPDRTDGLASERFTGAPSPRSLSNPAGGIDAFVRTQFGEMAYGSQAVSSPFFRQMIARELAATAVDLENCTDSVEFSSFLSSAGAAILGAHVNRVAGVGRSIFDFRANLPFGHPCLGPGQQGLFPDLLFLAENGDLIGQNAVTGAQMTLRSIDPLSVGYAGLSFSSAILADASAGTRQALFLSTDGGILLGPGGQGSLATTLFSLDLNNPNSTPVSIFSAFQGSGDFFFGSGLATIGTRIFAMATEEDTQQGQVSTKIIEILPGGQGSAVLRMFLPLDGTSVDNLAGSNARGSTFVVGDPDLGSGESLSDLSSVFELDPRNNYISFANRLNVGSGTTINGGIDPQVLVQHEIDIVASAFINGRLFLTVFDSTLSTSYDLVVNPFAAGTSNNPTVLSLSPAGTPVRRGLGSESLTLPPASVSLAGAPANIDTFIDALFAQAAFSGFVATSDSFARLVTTAIARSSVDPVSCAGTLEPSALTGFLANMANRRAGVGGAVFDYRASLDFGHPCLGPGQLGTAPPLYYVDSIGDALRGRSIFDGSDGVDALLRSPVGASGGSFDGEGLAVLANVNSPGDLSLLRLESSGTTGISSWTLRSLTLTGTSGGFSTIGSNGASDRFLFGLGTVEGGIYANAKDLNNPSSGLFQVVEFTGGSSLATRVELPLGSLQQGLGGSNERGTLFTLGDAALPPPPRGPVGPTAPGLEGLGQVLEVDPRNNYLVGAYGVNVGANTVISGGIDHTTVTRVTGMAWVGNRLVLTVETDTGGTAFVVYNPSASGTSQDPTVVRITQTTPRPGELASERRVPSPQPAFLPPPSSEVDTRTGGRFAEMAYSGQAAATVVNMVKRHTLDVAQDRGNCATSDEFNGTYFDQFVFLHVNEFGGVGSALGDARNGLAFNHPCQLPGSLIGYLFVDESAGTVVRETLAGGRTTVVSNPGFFDPINPLATSGVVAGGVTLMRSPFSSVLVRLESATDGNGNYFNTLRTLDLGAGAGAQFQVDPVVASLPGPLLTGVASLASDLFVAGRLGPAGRFGIGGLDPSTGLISTLIDTPLLGTSLETCAIGASHERNTVFVPATAAGFSIVEFDPRNNVMVDAFSSGAGQLAVTGGTNNTAGLTDFTQVTQVTAIAYNQGLITVSGRTSSGPVQFTINTFGDNSAQGPIVPRITPVSGTGQFGFGSQLGITPQPRNDNITNPALPPGGLDMRGLTMEFAAMAYTQRAFDSGVPTAMIRAAIAGAARDIDGCINSSELNGNLPSVVQSNIGFRSGVGRSVTTFRAGLPPGHPCQPN